MSYIDDDSLNKPVESHFRSANGSMRPEGVNDYTEAITHNGNVGIGMTLDPVSPLTLETTRNDAIRLRSFGLTDFNQFDGIGVGQGGSGLQLQARSIGGIHTLSGAVNAGQSRQFMRTEYRRTIFGDLEDAPGIGHWVIKSEGDDGSIEFRCPTTALIGSANPIQARLFCNAWSGLSGTSGGSLAIQMTPVVTNGGLQDRVIFAATGDTVFARRGVPAGGVPEAVAKSALVTIDGALRLRGGPITGTAQARQEGGLWFGADSLLNNGAGVNATVYGDSDSGISSVGDGNLTFYTNGAITGTVNGGVWAKPGGGVWAALSDMRLKDQVAPYTKGLSQLVSLAPITYLYSPEAGFSNPPGDERYVGFSAQELDLLFPEAVSEIPHPILGTALTIDMTPLIPALVNAVKEIEGRLARIEKVESYLTAWEDRLKAETEAAKKKRKPRAKPVPKGPAPDPEKPQPPTQAKKAKPAK